MSRHVGLGLVGLFITFFAVLLLSPYVKGLFVGNVSGFEDYSCKEGQKPCPEGHFCAKTTCVPILPKYNINGVSPSETL